MENYDFLSNFFYIDESGTMTLKYSNKHPYFVICIIRILDKTKFTHLIKSLFLRHSNLFYKSGDGKIEIKGSKLSFCQKIWLANYLKRPGLIEVFYIKVSNNLLESKTIYKSSSLAFNYFICKDFLHLIEHNLVPIGTNYLSIDNRNVANYHLKSLEDYLNLTLTEKYFKFLKFKVNYMDSKNSRFIQIADFFSNLYFSHLLTGNYANLFNDLKTVGVLKDEFFFPISPQYETHQVSLQPQYLN